MSHRFEAQFFSVVGPAFIPNHPGEPRQEMRLSAVEWHRPRKAARRPAIEALAVVLVLLTGIVLVASDVIAAVRHDQAARTAQMQRSSGALAVLFAGGTEPARW